MVLRRPELQRRDIVELVTDEKPTIPSSNTPGENGSWLKAAVIWLALIAVAVGIGFATGALRIAVGVLIFYSAAVLIVTAFQVRSSHRQARRLAADLNQGSGALARGELKVAHDVFWECARAAKLPYLAAVARNGDVPDDSPAEALAKQLARVALVGRQRELARATASRMGSGPRP